MKRAKIFFFYIVFLALLAEVGIGYVGYWITTGQMFSYSTSKQERRDILSKLATHGRVAVDLDQNRAENKRKPFSTEILHPYLGYVVDYHDDECPSIGFCDKRMRGYKDLLQGSDFPQALPDRAIVVVTGGSVAFGIANNSSKGKLEQALSTIPEFEGKEIIIYTFALGGYKQPQQLFAMQYYLSMGAHFDMVINIDGFNDIVLPQAENIPFQSNPYFPRLWHERVYRGAEDRRGKEFYGRQTSLNEQRKLYTEQVNKSIFRRSAIKNLIWKTKDTSFQKKLAQAEKEYLENPQKIPRLGSSLIITGTKFPTDDITLMLERIAQFWRRSSELMHDVAIANNIRYYHFLQPNQYVDGSKPMTEEERKIAFIEGHPYSEGAKLGYPYLISEGAKLHDSDVAFYDLTKMFVDNSEVLYFDACCHFNAKGYDYIIDKIVDSIKTDNNNAQ